MAPIPRPTYKDIDFLLEQNILTSEMNTKLDAFAVSQTIKNILLTTQGEKLFLPYFGGNSEELMFNSLNVLELENKKIFFLAVLGLYEPRASITNINITDSTFGYWIINIEYYIRSNPDVTRFLQITTE